MKKCITSSLPLAQGLSGQIFAEVQESFERFCLAAGIATLTRMLAEDATALWAALMLAMRGVRVIAGERRKERSAFTAARYRSNGQGCGIAMVRKCRCRIGNRQYRKNG